MTNFRERLHVLYEEFKDRNYTFGRKDFAKYLGISQPKLKAWLDGNGRPDFDMLKLIAKNAQVSVSWLIGEADSREIILPKEADFITNAAAQKEYFFVLDYLKYKYGVRPKIQKKDMG